MSRMFGGRRQRQFIYLMSFGDNLAFIQALAQASPGDRPLVVFYRPQQERAAQRLARSGIDVRPFRDNLQFVFKGIPQIMRARVLFCDNYYAFLGGLYHPQHMRIVQVWHAAGAIKRFGWDDPTTAERSASDQRRFQAVYDHFDEFVVGSVAMGRVFARSYRVPMARMQVLGYPRSDRYADPKWQRVSRAAVAEAAPELVGHRVILYAPTYREGVTFTPPAGLAAALTADPDAKVVVKVHPALAASARKLQAKLGQQVVVVENLSTTDLLNVAETVVTDYSSVAFDYSLVPNAHSLLFFLFDWEDYQRDPGVQPDLTDWLPGPIIQSTDQLATAIKADAPTDLTQFNQRWNTANDGAATQRVVDRYAALL